MSDQFVSRDKVVSFTYSILDESGEIVEQSDMPISYVHGGKHDLFTKVVEAMDGCVVGDTVEVALTQITVKLDGEILFELLDSSLSSGKIGFFCYAEEGADFDNITVYRRGP